MVRLGYMTLFLFLGIHTLLAEDMQLQKNCLACHGQQQIPSYLIYKRYLAKYSTPKRMEDAIYGYLKAPQKKRSIMPPQFFLKFPMKEPIGDDERELRENIRAYLKHYDIKKRLILKR